MSAFPENRNIIRMIGDTVARAPRSKVGEIAIIAAIGMGTVVGGQILQDAMYPKAAREAQKKQTEEITRNLQEALSMDYENTAGVDVKRVDETETFLFTITRPSAVLARTREEIIGRVTAKVSQETGCPSIITSVVWQDTAFRMPWIVPEPTIFSATAVCPK